MGYGLALVFCLASPLAAQQPAPTRPDTTQNPRPDTPPTPRDTSAQVPDSLNPDSTRPLLPLLANGAGPRPAGTRYIFDGDALRWSGQITLGELLREIPGVMLVRAGGYGQPETVSYMGQGAASIEIYRDGYQIDPLGEDSVSFDTGRFDIGMFRRIEVEVTPSVLRVHLISDTQSSMRARTEASFSTGDASTNSYRVRYLNRWPSGLGLGVGVSYLGTQGPRTSLAKSSELALWGKMTWMPNQQTGVELQVNRYSFESQPITPLVAGSGVPYPALNVKRSDVFLRAFSSTRGDGMGFRFDAIVGSSHYNDSAETLKRSSAQASITLGYGAAHFSSEIFGRLRDGVVPFDVGARAAVSPFRMLTLSSFVRSRRVLGGGGLREAAGAAEVRLLPWLALHGDARLRRLSDSLFVRSDTAQTVLDWSAGLGVRGALLTFDLSLTRRGDFSAPAFGLFRAQVPGTLTAGASAPQLTYHFQPRSWFSISGWIRMPSTDSVPYDPPTHSVTRVTFRSQFLPKLRRGVFDLELQAEVEGWGAGVMGSDAAGAPIHLSGHTVANFYLQIRLVGALIYFTLRNTQREVYQMLPGFFAPRGLQRFGIRWEFNN